MDFQIQGIPKCFLVWEVQKSMRYTGINVAEVHQFLFGDTDYQVSGTVKGIDDEIKMRFPVENMRETDEDGKENEKSEDKTSEETNHTESNIEVTEDGNAGTVLAIHQPTVDLVHQQ